MSTEYQDLFESEEWLSSCCGALGYLGLSEISEDDDGVEIRTGICSRCKEHATFYNIGDEDEF